jgi:uncharacterized membrane protein
MTMAELSNAKTNAQDKPSGASAVFNGRYMPPPEDGGGQRWVRTSMTIQASAEALYARWRDVESATQWHGQTVNVRRTGMKTSHWTMMVGDKKIEWESEILADEPGRRIAWHSIGGDLDEAGEVIFEPATGGRGTMVTVLQEYRMGALENLSQTISGRNPKQGVIESLRHFKALAETGEIPRTEGQPHGPRGAIANMKRSMYGETVPTPPGELRRAG